MLSQTTISKLASVLDISAEDLTAKLSSEKEEDITLPSGEFFSEDELIKRDKSKYAEGKDAGSEMLVKGLKKDFGYDIDSKNINDFLTHHEAQLKLKYSKEPNQRVEELEKDLEKIKNAHSEELSAFKSQNESLSKQLKSQNIKNKLLSIMPKETTISSNAIITLFNSEHDTIEDNGVKYVTRNGEKLKNDKTAEPLELDAVFNDWLVKEKYIKTTPGRGNGNEFGNNKFSGNSISDFQKQWQKDNPDKSFNDPKYSSDYANWRKEQKEVTA